MRGLLCLVVTCCAVQFQCYATIFSPVTLFDQDILQRNIEIRLLRRDWKPEGPSAKTDEVMDEYQWGVAQAYKGLRTSVWKYESEPLEEVEKLFTSDNYNKVQETIVIVHPVFASANVFFVKTTINALAMRNLHKKYNIFAVNMPKNNPQMLLSIWLTAFGENTYFEPMAKAVSKFLVVGVDGGHLKPDQIHLLGWSYSGQLVGYIGRFIGTKYGSKVASVVALDPYASALNDQLIHVSGEDDAQVVHVYHSNSFLAGTRERLGTADFVFNDGNIQPECKWPQVLRNTIKESMICSHMKAVQRFWYVILYPSKFVGIRCPTWNRLMECLCHNKPTATLKYPIEPDTKAEGIYYLRTLDTKPYGLGKWGTYCSSENFLSMELENEIHNSAKEVNK